MPAITRESALMFSNQLRDARLDALSGAEGLDGIVCTLERIGSYRRCACLLIRREEDPNQLVGLMTAFDFL